VLRAAVEREQETVLVREVTTPGLSLVASTLIFKMSLLAAVRRRAARTLESIVSKRVTSVVKFLLGGAIDMADSEVSQSVVACVVAAECALTTVLRVFVQITSLAAEGWADVIMQKGVTTSALSSVVGEVLVVVGVDLVIDDPVVDEVLLDVDGPVVNEVLVIVPIVGLVVDSPVVDAVLVVVAVGLVIDDPVVGEVLVVVAVGMLIDDPVADAVRVEVDSPVLDEVLVIVAVVGLVMNLLVNSPLVGEIVPIVLTTTELLPVDIVLTLELPLLTEVV